MSGRIAGCGVSVVGATTLLALDDFLQNLVALGCSHAELPAAQLGITVAGQDNIARAEAVADICAKHPLRYTLHAPIAVNFMERTHAALHFAVLTSLVSFGRRIGASLVVLHPGRTDPRVEATDLQHLLQLERDDLRRAADLAGAAGMRIGMENLNPDRRMMAGSSTSYALDPARLVEQIDRIGHEHVAGVLDFGHAWLASARMGFDFATAIAAFAPYVGHLHITDNCGRPQTYPDAGEDERIAYGMGDLHLPIGWGSVPYGAVLPSFAPRPGTIAILELALRHQEELEPSVAATKRIAARLAGERSLSPPP